MHYPFRWHTTSQRYPSLLLAANTHNPRNPLYALLSQQAMGIQNLHYGYHWRTFM